MRLGDGRWSAFVHAGAKQFEFEGGFQLADRRGRRRLHAEAALADTGEEIVVAPELMFGRGQLGDAQRVEPVRIDLLEVVADVEHREPVLDVGFASGGLCAATSDTPPRTIKSQEKQSSHFVWAFSHARTAATFVKSVRSCSSNLQAGLGRQRCRRGPEVEDRDTAGPEGRPYRCRAGTVGIPVGEHVRDPYDRIQEDTASFATSSRRCRIDVTQFWIRKNSFDDLDCVMVRSAGSADALTGCTMRQARRAPR